MGRHRATEDVRESHLAVLGPELGPVYHAVYNQVVWLHVKWKQYVQLFGTSPERIDLLNQSASYFFRVIELTLWQDTLLHLARLTDPPQTGRKDNLTIRRLPDLVGAGTLKVDLQKLIDAAGAATDFVRDWRNRHIAHRDLKLALQDGAQPLVPASREQVNEAIAAISQVLQRLSLAYFDSEVRFDLVFTFADAESLLYTIRDGLDAEKQRRDRESKGNMTPEDLRFPPPV